MYPLSRLHWRQARGLSGRSDLIAAMAAITGLATAPVTAQSINIDFGTPAGTPSSDYGAAAGQPGVWNALNGGHGVLHPLVGLDGAPIDATVEFVGSLGGDLWSDAPATTGNDERLLDDYMEAGGSDIVATILLAGLVDGPYEILVYLWDQTPSSAGNRVILGDVRDPSVQVALVTSGAWTGTFEEGTTHAAFSTQVTDGTLIPTPRGGTFETGSINGVQLTLVPEPGTLVLLGAGGLVLLCCSMFQLWYDTTILDLRASLCSRSARGPLTLATRRCPNACVEE